ncbi:hypothetical protein QG516_04045 [Pedobacter gandavensis]|uniref:hypothetical protein n=1 Tax=Pedobacter gandavensis TaxID=2679963 RepID=UPI0024791057|nr:hypothetical protein [Pedobacter gandavensis]WGQ10825.1 hypothetical protein QG516_04045 [Pedobacter gandavensis]
MLEIEIKPNLLDRDRKLVISPDIVSYEDSNWKDIPNTTFNKDEIEGLRFGVEPIQGYVFTIGRRYCVDMKGFDGRLMKIRFTSLYGIRAKQLHEKHLSILSALFNTHQEDIINRYVESFNRNSFVEILGTTFKTDSVTLNGNNILYDNLGFKEYKGYYTLFSKSNPKIYKAYSYLKDWNSAVVYSMSKHLLASITGELSQQGT